MEASDMTQAQGVPYPIPTPRRRILPGSPLDLRAAGRRGAAAGLLGLLGLGSLALWTAVPARGLWLASQLSESSTQVSAGPALAALLGIPGAMLLGAAGLARVERVYLDLTGHRRYGRVPAWRRSLSDSRTGPSASVLDKAMVVSVIAAALTFTAWFLLFAGSPLP